MKLRTAATAAAVAGMLAASQALAQQPAGSGLAQPTSARQIAYTYDAYYAQDEAAPAPEAAATDAGPCTTCDSCASDDSCCEDSCCDSCKPCFGSFCDLLSCSDCDSCYMFGPAEEWSLIDDEVAPFDVGGWQQGGYTNRSDGAFNTHPNRFNLHQSWLFIGRAADGSNGADLGFRTDLVYGVDAQNTQAFGNNPGRYDYQNGWDHGIYGWALPQLYGEVAIGDLNVKAGHFFTPAGYEVVPAPGNFFFSHAFTHNYTEPFTHTGVLGTYQATEVITVYAGWTLGWDTGFDRRNDGSNFLGGFGLTLMDGLTFAYITEVGNLGWVGDGYGHSIVATAQVTEKVLYVLSSDILKSNDYNLLGTGPDFNSSSVVNYLFYELDDCWSLGGRLEWWKPDGVSIYEMTGGINYKPHANWWIRPEIRYNWSPAGGLAAIGVDNDAWVFGIDTYITY